MPEGVVVHGKIRGADVEARRITSPLSFELNNGQFTGEQLSSPDFTVTAANGIKASVRSVGKIRAIASGDHDTELHLPAGRYAIDAKTSPLRGAVEIEEGIRHDPNATGRVFARADHWPRSREHRTGHVRIKIADPAELNHDPSGTSGDNW